MSITSSGGKRILDRLFPLDRGASHVPYIVLLCLLLYFPFLGARDFWDSENLYAEITRIMMIEQNLALPKINDTLWIETPPLFFWLPLFLSWLVGGTNEWTIRLPSALAATALMVIYYVFLKEKFGSRVAFLSTLVLTTSFLTIHVERHIPINMILFLLVTLALLLWMEVLVFDSTRLRHAYGAWFFMGIAFLTKGPIGFLLPGTVVCLYIVLSRRWEKIVALRAFSGSLLFLGIVLPWFLFVFWKTSGVWMNAFFIPGNIGSHAHHLSDHPEPIYNLIVGLIPWSFLVIPAVISLWPDKAKIRDRSALFMCLWFLSVPLFALVSDRQHSHYLFLMFFPVALVFGVYLDKLTSPTPTDSVCVWTDRSVLFCCAVLALAGVSAPVIAMLYAPQFTNTVAYVSGVFIVAAAALFYLLKKHNYGAVLFGFAAFMIGANLLVQGLVLPSANNLAIRPFAEKMGALVKPGSEVGVVQRRPSYYFNFYSRIKKFEILKQPKLVEEFLKKTGDKYVVGTDSHIQGLTQSQQKRMKVILIQPRGDRERWPAPGYWMLLHACNAGDESDCAPK